MRRRRIRYATRKNGGFMLRNLPQHLLLTLSVWLLPGAAALAQTSISWEQLPQKHQAQLRHYQQAFQQARSALSLKLLYEEAQGRLGTELAAPFQAIWDAHPPGQEAPLDFERLSAPVPGLKLAIMAEGTIAVWLIHYPDWARQARQTLGASDDRFMALMQKIHGPLHTGYRQWMVQTWDYGGCSRLGSGKHTELLQALRQELQQPTPFRSILAEEVKALSGDLLLSKELCGSRAQALQEVKDLQASLPQQDPLKAQLNARLQALQTLSEAQFLQAPD